MPHDREPGPDDDPGRCDCIRYARRANYVDFVDTATRKIQHYVPVGRGPRGVALSDDEKTLYVVNGLSDDVSIIDVASRKVITAVPVGHAPYSVMADD
jgi:YVTN family beta-propeller protein